MERRSIFIVLLLILNTLSWRVQAQCEASVIEAYNTQCLEKIKPLGFNFLKNYKLDGQGGNKRVIEVSYVFSTGTTYVIAVANAHAENKGLAITLFDAQRNKVASSFIEDKKVYYPAIQLECKKTGIYYISFSFVDTKEFCGGAVLGFKR